MASITGKPNLFFVTSPRTPMKMREEINLLLTAFAGRRWDKETQRAFASKLSQAEFFEGSLQANSDFGARDRINRGPKALGLVNLEPALAMTEAGQAFVHGKRPEEALLRQLLKFQLPSPYHIDREGEFGVKPYLELLRLVVDMEGLSKDEIALFFMEMIHYELYDQVKAKIEAFRTARRSMDRTKTSYKRLVEATAMEQMQHIYRTQIAGGTLRLREQKGTSVSLTKFLKQKWRNHLDYADAAIRYMRASQLVSLEPRTYKLVVSPDKQSDIQFVLEHCERMPKDFSSADEFKAYLFDQSQPRLYGDDRARLLEDIKVLQQAEASTIEPMVLTDSPIDELKDIRDALRTKKFQAHLHKQKEQLRTYQEYEDIEAVFRDIVAKNVIDQPLFLEWNVWRAMAMLNDGQIDGHFKMDDAGMPLHTASGNQPDILCQYEGFDLLVEVTMSSGARQYEMEGEPVARHCGNHQKKSGKPTFCLFIAPNLHEATVAHFYVLHRLKVDFYGGDVKIIPLRLMHFQKLLAKANAAKEKPRGTHLGAFMQYSSDWALQAENETKWYEGIVARIDRWV